MRSEIAFNNFTARIKDKIIKSKVTESNKAEEKYNDAIASGNTGIASSYDEKRKIFSLKIGNLPKHETLYITFSFLQFVDIKDSFYFINIIKDFPLIKKFRLEKFEGKIIIETYSEITDLIYKSNLDDNDINLTPFYSNGNKKCEITYDNSNSLDKILFKTLNMEKPLLISQYNNKLDETNYILNYYYNNNENNNKKYPCLFIFLIDQSYSMQNTINNVIKTLTKIMQLLPEDSYYQLIGFGSNYKIYNNLPAKNTKENLKEADNIINSLKPDLGGTNLSLPLNHILKDSYSDYKDINISKQIIVLTDGDINIGEDIAELIKLHNNEFRIHCIGIGNEINKKLIIEASIAGNGSFYFINNSLDELDSKVSDILNNCTKEYINNYEFILNNNKNFELNPVNKTTYNKESINYCFIQKGKEKNGDDLNIIFNWENMGEKFKKNFGIKYDDIITLIEGEDLSKLIIGLALRYEIINNKEEKIKLSKLYQVLCNYTTLFAEIEGEKIIENKMITLTQKHSSKKAALFRESYSSTLRNYKHCELSAACAIPAFKRVKESIFFSKNNIWICSILIIIILSYFIKKLKLI